MLTIYVNNGIERNEKIFEHTLWFLYATASVPLVGRINLLFTGPTLDFRDFFAEAR